MDSRERRELDRWITGNYGEDQLRDDDPDGPREGTTFADMPPEHDEELPRCGCDWTSRCETHAHLDHRDDPEPPYDDTNSYECPRCTRDGLGRHPFTVPPCDPVSRYDR